MNEKLKIEELQRELIQTKKENDLLYEKITKLKMDNALLKRRFKNKEDYEKDLELEETDTEIIPSKEKVILKQKGLEELWEEKVTFEICKGLSIFAKRNEEKQCYILENDFPLYFPITQEELDARGYTKI